MVINRIRMKLIAVSVLPLIIGALLAYMLLDAALIGEVLIANSRNFSIESVVIQSLVSTGLGSLIVVSIFYMIQRKGSGAKKALVSIIVSPLLTISFYLLGQSLLLILFKSTTPSIWASLLSLASLGVFLMSFVFIITDSIPPFLKNFFVIFYGSIFGTFLGVIFITASMFVLVISVVFEDYFLSRYTSSTQEAFLSDIPGEDPFDFTRIQTKNIAVGVGDYLAFSLISAHSLLFFPLHVWAMSMLLATIGIVINATVFVKEEEILPAIPLPAILALFPWVVHLLTLSIF
ncbi:hypothetical protein EU527_05875 [Candidatus Thorarchaeota archaeon]|nr:MAG: hypothetical protein EU527_05875 [Candidatus Thorarchaeota archaeon]